MSLDRRTHGRGAVATAVLGVRRLDRFGTAANARDRGSLVVVQQCDAAI